MEKQRENQESLVYAFINYTKITSCTGTVNNWTLAHSVSADKEIRTKYFIVRPFHLSLPFILIICLVFAEKY